MVHQAAAVKATISRLNPCDLDSVAPFNRSDPVEFTLCRPLQRCRSCLVGLRMIAHQWHDLQNQLAAEQVGPSVLTSPAQQLLLPATLGCCLGNPTREAKGAPAGSVSAASFYTAALTSLSASAEVELFVLDTQDTLTAEEALQLAGSSPAPPYAYATPAAPIPAPPRRAPLKRPAPPGLASAPRAPKRVFTSPYTVFCKEQRPLMLPGKMRNADREKLLGELAL
eukprot:scaffold46081_cov84-Phaeocystis_antarctica.AAC.1